METEILRHIPADIHNHSTLSPDGCDEPMRMAERACGLGIKHFALTDHIECEKLESWDYAGAIARSHDVFLEIQIQLCVCIQLIDPYPARGSHFLSSSTNSFMRWSAVVMCCTEYA